METPNPPAFPTMEHGFNKQGIPTVLTYEGMALRDYFAAKAMQGILSNSNRATLGVAEKSYLIADQMLKARNK